MADEPIRGMLRDATGGSVPDLEVLAFALAAADQRPIGKATSNTDGFFEIGLTPKVRATLVKSKAQVFFQVLRDGQVVVDTRDTVLWHPTDPTTVEIPVRAPSNGGNGGGDGGNGGSDGGSDGGGTGQASVNGLIVSDRGGAVGDLRVEVWDHQLRGAERIALGSTGSDGRYDVGYDPAKLVGKQLADIEVRVRQGDGRAKELVRSKVTYQAPPQLTVDLVVPFDSLARPDEYARLAESVGPLLGDTAAREVDAGGVVFLANRGGFDPRPIAMTVAAERGAAQTGIPAEHYYALFRTGAAADVTSAHQLTDERLVSAITSAVDAGLIRGDLSIDQTLAVHQEQARVAFRAYQSPGAVSTLGDLLSIRLNGKQTDQFIDQLRATRDDPATLWDNLAQSGMDPKLIARLQTDGQLGHLTRQNAPVIGRLVKDQQVSTTGDLARRGLYEADAWKDVIGSDVPAGLTARAYAEGMALQVRLAHPTLVAADLVRRQQVDLGVGQASAAVAEFLDAGSETNVLGSRPLSTWESFDALDDTTRHGALRLERMYQISPSDGSMKALGDAGLDSAFAVTRYTEGDFLAAHGDGFPSMREATMAYRKAQQVSATALNLTVDYLNLRRGPHLGVLNGLDLLGPVLAEDTPAKATLETLFGNLDFCACEECRSVLSPAAYFVDLLEMLDLADIPHELDDPQVVLFDRRPDLAHLLLTCENTNVALSYLDLVNEVLEFYVAHGSLAGFDGHNTAPDATTAELLVDPPFIEEAAYAPLADAIFPVPLPFHLPLESLRLDFEAWDTTLADALTLFGTPAQARHERLGLNPAQYSILTDNAFRKLPEHFGQPASQNITQLNAAISNAKVFCRRLGLAYVDLDAILMTRFVNPGSVLVPLLTALHVGLDVIESWSTGAITDNELTDQFPADLDPAAYGGDVLQWLADNHDLIMHMVVLTPIADADPELDDCDFAALELRLALPDPGANRLTAVEYTKLYRFVRLWHQLGGTIAETDALLAAFLPTLGPQPSLTDLDSAVSGALDAIANFRALVDEAGISDRLLPAWLALFDQTGSSADRRTQLGRLLRLGDDDAASLAALIGVDPLADDMASDEPSLLRYVRARATIKAGPLEIADLDWLVRHRDPGGALAPPPDTLRAERRLVRDALGGVETMLGAAGADLASTQAAMALVYDPAVAGRFFGLLEGTTTYDAPLSTDEEAVPAKLLAADPNLGIDPFGKRLLHVGILTASAATALDGVVGALTLSDMSEIDTAGELTAYQAAFTTAVGVVRDAGAADRDLFAAEYPELGTVLDDALAEADPTVRAGVVRDGVLPELRARLQTVALRATLVAVLGIDDSLVAALTAGPEVLHAEGNAGTGVLADLVALATPLDLDHDQAIDAFLDPVVTDDHILYLRAPSGTVVQLDVDETPALALVTVGPSGEAASAVPVGLTVGTPVRLSLTIGSLPPDSAVTLAWRTKGMAKAEIPADRLTLSSTAATAESSLLRMHKAAGLVSALSLTARELAFFAGAAPDTSGVLADLPVDDSLAPADVVALTDRIDRLGWFAALRTATESEPDSWVGILETGGLGTADGQAQAAAIGSWHAADVSDAVAFLAPAPADLFAVTTLRTLRPILDLTVTTNQSVADLVSWTTSDPTPADVAALEDAVKARVDAASWSELMRTAHDELRNRRRDALVAWILTFAPPTPDITNADELYEHFLIDVEMDACMQTSRIRLALSVVQLFVTRCLMGLEERVDPASISADHWTWMRRYRVWEANRKIFLYPENWLEPELRDGKSSFFNELEADLLKSDITDESAENAFLAYLKKLDDVARLELVGLYLQQGQPGRPEDDILHLFGRTNTKNREYWYRRFEYGYWTPWEKVGLHIEGEAVIPIMWRSQLYLFWLTAVPKPRRGNQDTSTSDMASQHWQSPSLIDVELTLSWGEYFNGAWVSPKSTNMRTPLVVRGLKDFHPESMVLAARTVTPTGMSERLVCSVIYLHDSDVKAYSVTFTSKNREPIVLEDLNDATLLSSVDRFNQHLFWDRQPEAALDSSGLDVPRLDLALRIAQPANATTTDVDETLLTKKSGIPGYHVRTAMHPVENQWEAPFVYSDETSTFVVQPDESVRSFVDHVDYVPIPIGPIQIEIPPLIEQVAIPNPLDPIWDPPWIQVVNPNLGNVIADTGQFDLDGVSFDAVGLMG